MLSQRGLQTIRYLPMILPLGLMIGLMLGFGRLYRDSGDADPDLDRVGPPAAAALGWLVLPMVWRWSRSARYGWARGRSGPRTR